ncbi:MAG TPA: glycosyltransferase [Thermodesulfovibrionales bacterium]|nr:glycosyltransferase [Thermodesulfovibrionales bacterium]
MLKIGIATTMDDRAPSYHLRFRSVLEALRRDGQLTYYPIIRKRLFGSRHRLSFEEGTDRILIARMRTPDYLKMIYDHAADRKIPVIYESDDLVLYERRRDEFIPQADMVAAYLQMASCLVVSTPYLGDELRYYNHRAFVFPNLVDPDIWQLPGSIGRRENGRIRICCIGTGLMSENISLIVPAIENCGRRYGRDVVFWLWGNAKYLGEKVGKLKNVRISDKRMPYRLFARRLQREAFDIGVVPLSDLRFNRAKSNIKYLEYAVSGIPAIFSRVEAYAGLFDGETCLLAENDPDAWQEKIERLIEDGGLRTALADRAFEDVRSRFVLDREWMQKYLLILEDAGDGIQPE